MNVTKPHHGRQVDSSECPELPGKLPPPCLSGIHILLGKNRASSPSTTVRTARSVARQPTPVLALALLIMGTVFAVGCAHNSLAENYSERPAHQACERIEGLSAHLRQGKILLLGEMHGTAEAPRFVRDTICAALAADLSVTIALEMPVAEKATLEAYKRLGGPSEAAREILRASEFWQTPDGRSSQAVLSLIDEIFQWQEEGKSIALVLFDDPAAEKRDLAMADHIAKASDELPENLLIVLTGNLHNRMTRGIGFDENYEPMGFFLRQQLPERTMISLNLSFAGGEAWNCMAECKINPLPVVNESLKREIILTDQSGKSAYHGVFHVGKATASLPALEIDTEGLN